MAVVRCMTVQVTKLVLQPKLLLIEYICSTEPGLKEA
jgi:hypothetical protein